MIDFCSQQFTCPLESPFSTSSGKLTEKTFLMLQVSHKDKDGYGEFSVSPSLKAGTLEENRQSIADFCANLTHCDLTPDKVTETILSLTRLMPAPAASGLSSALLDLACKINDLSIPEIIGLELKDDLKSCLTLGRDETNFSDADLEKNFSYIKIKIENKSEEKSRLSQVANNHALPLWLDAEGENFTVEEFLDIIRDVPSDKLYLIEDVIPPLKPQKLWIENKPRNLLTFCDKGIFSLEDITNAQEHFDGVVIKPLRFGGILPSLMAIELARSYGLKIALGCYTESDLSLSSWMYLASLCDFVDMDGSYRLKNQPFSSILHTETGIKVPKQLALGNRYIENRISN